MLKTVTAKKVNSGFDRLVYCEFKKQFVEKVTETHHILADPHLDEKIRDPKFIRGFIHLILDGYRCFLKHRQPEFDQVAKDEWNYGDRKDKNLTKLLHSEFDFTGSKEDFISVAKMANFRNKYKKEFITISNKRFNEIVESTFKIKQDRKNTSRGLVWFEKERNRLLLLFKINYSIIFNFIIVFSF